MSLLNGHRLGQVWTWGNSQTLAGVIGRCQTFGLTGFFPKALDGIDYMRAFDPSPHAIGCVDDARAQAEVAAANGLLYGVWVNCRPFDLEEQAERIAAFANAPGVRFVALDVEPYPRFYWGIQPAGMAREFMERIRDAAPDAYLVLQPDPRPDRLADIKIEEWLPYVDALAGQHYHKDFGTGILEEMRAALDRGMEFDKPVYPTLQASYGDAQEPVDPAEIADAVAYLEANDVSGCLLYKLDNAADEVLQAFSGPVVATLRRAEQWQLLQLADVLWGRADQLGTIDPAAEAEQKRVVVLQKELTGINRP